MPSLSLESQQFPTELCLIAVSLQCRHLNAELYKRDSSLIDNCGDCRATSVVWSEDAEACSAAWTASNSDFLEPSCWLSCS